LASAEGSSAPARHERFVGFVTESIETRCRALAARRFCRRPRRRGRAFAGKFDGEFVNRAKKRKRGKEEKRKRGKEERRKRGKEERRKGGKEERRKGGKEERQHGT
jgi:hypothetical protein